MKFKAEKYSGLITITAVIIAVEYSDSPYDIWDMLLGVLVIIVSFFYAKDVNSKKDGLFSVFLVGNLFTLGFIAILYTILFAIPQEFYSQCVVSVLHCRFGLLTTKFVIWFILMIASTSILFLKKNVRADN